MLLPAAISVTDSIDVVEEEKTPTRQFSERIRSHVYHRGSVGNPGVSIVYLLISQESY